MTTKAFLTGSQVYGTPHDKSDVDLVVFMDRMQLGKLAQLSEEEAGESAGGTQAGSLRFGNLNLICVTNPVAFEVWKETTERLKELAPVTRDQAVRAFRAARKRAGLSPDCIGAE